MLLEFVAPGLVVLFFGIGAWVVSLAAAIGLVDSISSQMLLFSAASVLSLVLLRTFVKDWFVGDSSDEEDEMLHEFVGKVVKVIKAIPGGVDTGIVELKGADWRAYSDTPHAAGDLVLVTDREGLTLKVEATS